LRSRGAAPSLTHELSEAPAYDAGPLIGDVSGE